MNERDLERMQTDAALGQFIGECVAAVLAGRTLAQAQRDTYKYTDCGAHLAWALDGGGFIYNGDPREHDPTTVAHVVDIGVGSIIEGSDAYVPLRWLGLPEKCQPDADGGYSTPEDAAVAFDAIVEQVDAEAADLWEATHNDAD